MWPCRGGGLEARHGEAAERQPVVAVAFVCLKHLINLADAEVVLGQGVIDAANELSHGFSGPPKRSHAVACKDLLTGLAQPGPVLLQTTLHRAVITKLGSAEPAGVALTCRLLLRRAHMTLGK
jgi:hypothetical protein